jgi:hypothetical protein
MNNTNKQNTQTNNTQRVKLKFWQYLLILSVTALVVSAVLKIITPQGAEVVIKNEVFVKNIDKTESTFKKVVFSGERINIPESFNLYKISQTNISADLLANQIINQNSLIKDERVDNYWVGKNSALSKSLYENNFTYSEILNAQDNDVLIIKEEAVKSCLNFYSKHALDLGLIPQEDAIIFLSKGLEQEYVEEKDAYYAQIYLSYELDGFPVFYQNEAEYPFFCKIDNNYNLERVVFKNFFYGFEIVESLSPLSIDQAISNIKKGTVSIISAESQITHIIDLNWINEADLYSVEIEYRYDDELKIAYPFYRFEGRLTNSAGINIQATLITPAVATAKSER